MWPGLLTRAVRGRSLNLTLFLILMKLPRLCFLAFLALVSLMFAHPASAHPMGNFSINHYARFEANSGELKLRYVLDFAEIPTADQMALLDPDGDGKINSDAQSAYLKTEVNKFLSDLSLQLDGKTIALNAQKSSLEVRPGAGGLPTLLVKIDCVVPLPDGDKTRVVYGDANFSGRTGWKEILAVADGQRAIADSDAGTIDQSRELTIFPIDAGIVPPRQTNAQFSIVARNALGNAQGALPAPATTEPTAASASKTNANTPQNRFTQSIAEITLSPVAVGWGLLFAFAFGAVHALSPGHGKTMVAAYLVGSRGTPRHAFTLGLVVTITHTFGVFALGFALLFASRYIVPEKLFPALSALSGLIIFGVGLWLFMSRYQGLQNVHSQAHEGHAHSHDDEHAHDHAHDGHAHSHDDEHSHSHDAHGAGVHSHGGRAHSHAVPAGPITTKTLVALGVSGGIVPCPEALVVLLAAIKLHRIGYGLILIVAFSLGLAAALIAIGMLVVSARQRLTRFGALGEDSKLVRYLPLGSAAVITLIGAALTLQATLGSS